MKNDKGSDGLTEGGSPVLEISQDNVNDEDDSDGWVHPDERDKPSFIERRAMGMANRPCLHLLTALVVAITLSAIGLIVGDFSISAENAGWESRGTRIADRQAQVILVDSNRDELLSGNPAIWDGLQNNIQERFDERRLAEEPFTTTSNLIASRARDIHTGLQRGNVNGKRERSFHLNQEGNSRNLQALDACETDWYGSDSMLYDSNLWPVWKTVSDKTSALSPDVMLEICEAETSTQAELERQGLCMGCPDGKCLPPFSLILMVRTMLDSFDSSCAKLMQAYAPEEDFFTSTLQTCVEDIKASADISSVTSCPEGFYPSVVDDKFGANNPVVQYTSSYYYTGDDNVDAIYDIVKTFDRSNGGLVSGVYETTNEDFVNDYIDSVLISDMTLAMASAFVTVFAMVLHTRSLWLSFMGLLQIILSFPLSFFVYKFLGGIQFFPFLNFIGVFVVFALGADDVFVAVDKWKNARRHLPNGSTQDVARFALPEAAGAMFLTSITTAAAFFSTTVCPVAPLKCFAIFCGLLIMFDYFMNVLLVFPALCLYDIWLQKGGTRCWLHFGKQSASVEDEKLSLIHRILGAYYSFVHKFRWFLLAGVLGAVAACAVTVPQLTLPKSADVRLLSEKNQFERHWVWQSNLLSRVLAAKSGSEAVIIWGVLPADNGDLLDPQSFTTLVLDKSFNPSSVEAQNYMLRFCADFFAQDFTAPPYEGYECPMNLFDTWLAEQATNSTDSAYITSCNGATSVPLAEADFHACIIAWSRNNEQTEILATDGEVRIMTFIAKTYARFDSPYEILDDEWKSFEKFLKAERKIAPEGVNGMFHSSEDFWWYDTNGKMLSTAVTTGTIALACAAVIILLSSRSFVMTIFCIVSIGYVLLATTACLIALGWELGL
uniref:SSD domain-containing protein n=1 Tax=Attheya septentrionalis TaxID=420275 RepID=A0A7S2UED4_9STRA|mmetsp:Transcript_19133/g.34694  ORF Transcript_19133/g.34694 Transcript_19133/m.34694 type:complete len:890 (+) Transcript_19133:117-2786(+)